jgi:hypothetical protein
MIYTRVHYVFPKVTVEGISRRMLTLNLRKLERDGLHGRSATATPSPRPAGNTTVNAGNAERSWRFLPVSCSASPGSMLLV